jgi:ribosomal-protein-alanine N-acetyltransferase
MHASREHKSAKKFELKNLRAMDFKLAQIADAATVSIMSRDLIERGLGWSWTPSRVTRHIQDPNAVVLLATVAAQPIGFAIMSYTDTEAHLKLLAVKPAYRCRGVGQRLIGWLEESALVAGTPMVYLELRANNKNALAFYEKLGYRNIGVIAGYYCRHESAVRMGRDLWA